MWGMLGVNAKIETLNNSFKNPFDNSREVYVFSDTPHLLKTVRNRLYTKKTLQVSQHLVMHYLIIQLIIE